MIAVKRAYSPAHNGREFFYKIIATNEVMDDIFKGGYLNLLIWAQQLLRYPKLAQISSHKNFKYLLFSAEGEIHFYVQCVYLMIWCFSLLGGHLHMFQHLYDDNPLPLINHLCNKAARHGHLALLQWLISRHDGVTHERLLCTNAAAGGHLEILKWIHANSNLKDVFWGSFVCSLAAGAGHLNGRTSCDFYSFSHMLICSIS